MRKKNFAECSEVVKMSESTKKWEVEDKRKVRFLNNLGYLFAYLSFLCFFSFYTIFNSFSLAYVFYDLGASSITVFLIVFYFVLGNFLVFSFVHDYFNKKIKNIRIQKKMG